MGMLLMAGERPDSGMEGYCCCCGRVDIAGKLRLYHLTSSQEGFRFLLIVMTMLCTRALSLPVCCNGAMCSTHTPELGESAEFVGAYASDMIPQKYQGL